MFVKLLTTGIPHYFLLIKFSRIFCKNAKDPVAARECLFNLFFGFASFAEVTGETVFFFSCVPADLDAFYRNFQLLDG